MKFQFVKSLLLGSLFALGSIGLTACGDDSSSAGDGDSSSSAEKLILSSVSETSPLAESSKIEAERIADGKGGFALRLTGSIATESDAFVTPNYEGEEQIEYQVDSLSFDVGRIEKSGDTVRVGNLPVPVKSNFQFPKYQFSLVFAIDQIPLDQKVIGCGDFVLYVTIYMSGDKEETKEYAFTARLMADFDLPCITEVSSSSVAEVCTQVDSVMTELSNISNQITAKQAINFNTGTTDNPHVTLSIGDGTGYLVAGNGVTFQQITSYDNSNGMWAAPTAPVCLEKFTYSASFDEPGNSSTKVEMRESTQWYMAITSDGNFPIRPSRVQTAGSEGTIYFIYYKKTN
ncbi:MAG: hypothetical protein IKS02_03505 [Fibrobacter sp.]|nr:hypothetical protein [Fibrobacter sp.]